jgi:hypothetical protein
LVPVDPKTREAVDATFTFGGNVRVPAAVQFITFVSGTVVMVIYGALTIRSASVPSPLSKADFD